MNRPQFLLSTLAVHEDSAPVSKVGVALTERLARQLSYAARFDLGSEAYRSRPEWRTATMDS